MDPSRSRRADGNALDAPLDGGPGRTGPRAVVTAAALVGVAVLAAAGCAESEFGRLNPTESARMNVSFQVPQAEPEGSSAVEARTVSADVTIDDEPLFTVDSVDVVMRHFQLGREGTTCETEPQGVSADRDGTDCEEVWLESLVEGPPVDEGVRALNPRGGAPIEPGVFDRIVFELNVLEAGQPEDSQILNAGRPELRGASVLIVGTFDGEPFELFLAPEGVEVVPAASPLDLGEEQTGTMSLVWNVSQWFDDGEGGIIDPVAAAADTGEGQALRDQIAANLVQTLEVETSLTEN